MKKWWVLKISSLSNPKSHSIYTAFLVKWECHSNRSFIGMLRNYRNWVPVLRHFSTACRFTSFSVKIDSTFFHIFVPTSVKGSFLFMFSYQHFICPCFIYATWLEQTLFFSWLNHINLVTTKYNPLTFRISVLKKSVEDIPVEWLTIKLNSPLFIFLPLKSKILYN